MKREKLVLLHGLLGSKNQFEYLGKELDNYEISTFDILGFGDERKPRLKYDVNDFLNFLERKLGLIEDTDTQYILVGHSLGALLAKELTIKYQHRVIKSFLISYPFLEGETALHAYGSFDRKYAQGAWWTKLCCQTEILYKWIFYPFIYIFRYKYRKSYIDFFKHTYQSAYGAIRNTIFEDNKKSLYKISDKVVLINGEQDKVVDLDFCGRFNNYTVAGMGHNFFGHERLVAEIIKSNI